MPNLAKIKKESVSIEKGIVVGNKTTVSEQESMEHKIREQLAVKKDKVNDLRVKKDLIKNALERDAEYYKANEAVKDQQRIRTAVKEKVIKNNPNLQKLNEEIQSLKEEVKYVQLTIEDYVLEYQEKTGMLTIEDDEKIVRNIVIVKSAKIV